MKQKFFALMIGTLMASLVIIGCGDSNNDTNTYYDGNNNGSQVGTIQVEFDRTDVLAQTTDATFATATNYAVDVVNAGTRNFIRPSTYVAAVTTQERQVILLTGIPVGTFDVIITGYRNGVVVGQAIAQNVVTNTDLTTRVGENSTRTLSAVTGEAYLPNFLPGEGPTGTSGGTTTTGTTGGSSTTTGTTGGTVTGTGTTGGSTTTTGTTGGSTTTTGTTGGNR